VEHDAFLALRCNFPLEDGKVACGKMPGEAWITSCSHFFCPEHASKWFAGDDRCPICLDAGGKPRMAKVCTSKAKSGKQTVLVGLSPQDIQTAVSTGMGFWVRQKEGEYNRTVEDLGNLQARHAQVVQRGRKRLAEAEQIGQQMSAASQDLRHRLQEAEQKREERQETIETIKKRISKVRGEYKAMQNRAMGLTPLRGEVRTDDFGSVKDQLSKKTTPRTKFDGMFDGRKAPTPVRSISGNSDYRRQAPPSRNGQIF